MAKEDKIIIVDEPAIVEVVEAPVVAPTSGKDKPLKTVWISDGVFINVDPDTEIEVK